VGGALSNVLFSLPVARRSAERNLGELIDRVRDVNEDSRFLYRVGKAVLFGSFLTDSPTMGDLGIAIDSGQIFYTVKHDRRQDHYSMC
jgi:hypothetical protein